MHPIFLKYWAHQLALRSEDSGASNLALALNDIRIDLLPHQITAVNRALKALQEHNGAILADEVGLGKTIEAGIVMYRHWQQGKRKILIVVPASLIEQWSKELREKFNLSTTVVDSRYLRRKNPPNPFICLPLRQQQGEVSLWIAVGLLLHRRGSQSAQSPRAKSHSTQKRPARRSQAPVDRDTDSELNGGFARIGGAD